MTPRATAEAARPHTLAMIVAAAARMRARREAEKEREATDAE